MSRELVQMRCDHPATTPHMVGCDQRVITAAMLAASLVGPLARRRVTFHGPYPPAPLSDVDEVAEELLQALLMIRESQP